MRKACIPSRNLTEEPAKCWLLTSNYPAERSVVRRKVRIYSSCRRWIIGVKLGQDFLGNSYNIYLCYYYRAFKCALFQKYMSFIFLTWNTCVPWKRGWETRTVTLGPAPSVCGWTRALSSEYHHVKWRNKQFLVQIYLNNEIQTEQPEALLGSLD